MKCNLIVATSHENGIGYRGKLPWNNKADLAHFAKMTRGNGYNAIVMGRKTWESLPRKPLPGRKNIILSRTLPETDNCVICRKLSEVIEQCGDIDELWVIGGAEIYKLFLENKMVDECYVTRIKGEYVCDVFMPSIRNVKINEVEF